MTCTDTAPKEPEEPRLMLHVPVRTAGVGYTLRLFRQRDGSRCAVAFTSAAGVTSLLGPAQQSIRLAEPALRALAAPLGATALVVDPQLVAPPVARTPELDTSPLPALQHQW